ncbi:MAG TPA: SRPBCC family protein [Thermoanaerobaculia bacterium]|jgi:hypothetical protein|nr:SRPBCC family protein [Thermoanaerobaculia bacterium]
MGSITIETRIRAAIDVCFDAARDVSLHVQSAAFSRERLVAPGRLEGLLQLGDLVCFEGRHFGIRQRFCARITELDRPYRFVDEMVRGMFKSMRHIHAFEGTEGGTLMRDLVTWEAPFGWIADALFLERHMRWFVETKQKRLKELVERREKV